MAEVALTMIVRNEAQVIDRCLASVRPHIDSYVICDTGSTDDTVDRIRAALRGIRGTIHHRAWQNFGHNRTELSDLARGVADHHLLVDADMTLHVAGDRLPSIRHGVAYLTRHHGEVDYLAPRVIDGHLPWRWRGAVHEILECETPYQRMLLEGVTIVHHGDGADRGRRRLERDLTLLRGDLEHDPDNLRTHFYLGLVLLGLGEFDKARPHLERRVSTDAVPADQRYYAALRLAQLEARARPNELPAHSTNAKALSAARRLVALDHKRAEGWVHLAAVLRRHGRLRAARRAVQRARRCPPRSLVSFSVRGAAGWQAGMEAARIALSSGDRRRAIAEAVGVLSDADAPGHARTMAHEIIESVWSVAKPPGRRKHLVRPFHPRSVTSHEFVRADSILDLRLDVLPRWRVTNPSIAATSDGYVVTAKVTNCGTDGGPYEMRDPTGCFRTLNVRVDLDTDLGVIDARPVPDPGHLLQTFPSRAIGLEDLRPVVVGDRLLALGWSRELVGSGVSGPVLVDLDGDPPILPAQPDTDRHEKNWMPFVQEDRLCVVSHIDPLVIREITETGALRMILRRPMIGSGITWRGGSQGIKVKGGRLFAVHERFSEAGRSRIMHRFVLIGDDLTMLGATDRFNLTGADIEFIAGLTWWKDRLVIALGVNDSGAELRVVDPDPILTAIRPLPNNRAAARRRRELARWPDLVTDWSNPTDVLEPTIDNRRPPGPVLDRPLPLAAVVHRARLVPR